MPAKTTLNRPEAMATFPPPRGITGEARRIWTEALQARPAVEWHPSDLHILGMYATAVSDVERLNREIAETGEVVDGRVHPATALRTSREKTAITCASKLRLLPSNRHTAKDAARFAAHGAKAARTKANLDDDEDGLLAGGGRLQ